MAESIAGVARALRLPYIFKASYDKANRTSLKSYRGPGLDEGLRILNKIARTVHVPVLTDVHEAVDVQRVAEIADIIQIPAFLCRQTDLLVAAARSGRAVNIKEVLLFAPGHVARGREMWRRRQCADVCLRERNIFWLHQTGVIHVLAWHN